MRAMELAAGASSLALAERAVPAPRPGQVLLRVRACAICRTDLHILDGELPPRGRPIVPGHQIVGEVVALGPPPATAGATRSVEQEAADGVAPAVGDRVGVPWLGWTCGRCVHCLAGRENLCDAALFTGYDLDGGYAEYAVADARYCLPIPPGYPDNQAAPLLCAGLIGYRALRLAGEAETLGLYGFGAAAHIVIQVAQAQGRRVVAFTRPGDTASQRFALELGAEQALAASAAPPRPLDAAILFAPAGELVPTALRAVRKGGTVVCAGIHMSDIPSFPYELLWGERVVRSVANLTRRDGSEFLALAPRIPVRTEVTTYRLEQAGEALEALRRGAIQGAGVLEILSPPAP